MQLIGIKRRDKAPPLWGSVYRCGPLTETCAVHTHSVSVDDLSDRDVDNWFGDGDQVWVLIHIEFLLQGWNVTGRKEETSVGEDIEQGNTFNHYTFVKI